MTSPVKMCTKAHQSLPKALVPSAYLLHLNMNIAIHVQDGDSTSSHAMKNHFPISKMVLCSGHVARAHEKQLKLLAKQKAFTLRQVQKYKELHSGMLDLRCCCTKIIQKLWLFHQRKARKDFLP
jgi:hypothetical protein